MVIPREQFDFGSAAANLFFMAQEAERQLSSISRVAHSTQASKPIITVIGVTDNGCRPIIELDFNRNEIIVSQHSGSGAIAPDTVYRPNSFEEWHELFRGAIHANFGVFNV